MSRHSLLSLDEPPPGYDPARVSRPIGKARFEAAEHSIRLDRSRAAALRRSADGRLVKPSNIERARCLASQLDAPGVYASRASAVWMRDQRIRIAGNLAHFIDQTGRDAAYAASIVPADGIMRPRELLTRDFRARKLALRSALVREGAASMSGWAVLAQDLSFNLDTGCWEAHFHGIVSGEMKWAVRELATRQAYASHRIENGKIWRGVVVEDDPLDDPLSWATYCFKTDVEARSTYLSESGTRRRSRFKHRLPEPLRTQALFWMDRWCLTDTTLLLGLYVGHDGFALSR